MNDLMVFNNGLFGDVRFVEVDGKPYAVANDIAKALGYVNISRDVQRHCKNIIKQVVYQNGTSHNKARVTQEMLLIPESDIYRLIIKSRLPQAEKFEKWVMEEVLPQIRKTGGYIPIKEEDDDITILSKAVLIAQKTIEKKDEIIRDLQDTVQELETDLEDCKILQNIIKSNDENLHIGDFSKLLCNNGIKIGRNTLFKWLQANKQISKVYGNYSPSQTALNSGHLRYEEQFVDTKAGTRVNYFILVTPKGVVYYAKKLLEEQLKRKLEEK